MRKMKVKVDDKKILVYSFLISESMNDKEIVEMCILLLKCVLGGWK